MAELSKFTLPDGSSYDLKVYTNHIAPMMSKTFTGVIGTEASAAGTRFYFGHIIPTGGYYENWWITYDVYVEAAGTEYAKAHSRVTISGHENTYNSYSSFNSIYSTSYRPSYYHILYNLKKAGIDAGYGHALGEQLYSGWNTTTAANSRTFVIDILECKNCTFEFFDNMIPPASLPGYNTTNYQDIRSLDFANNGMQQTGDNNDPNYRHRYYYNANTWKAYQKIVRYLILAQRGQDYLVPMNSTDNTVATTKTLTTASFNPFGNFFFYSSTTNRNADATIGNNAVLYDSYEAIDLRYSFNTGTTLIAGDPIYLVTVPQSDGMVKLDTDPIEQSLPSTANGKWYIFLGKAWDTYRIELYPYHPVYEYVDGEVKEYIRGNIIQDLTVDTTQTRVIRVPTASGGTTYGPGTSGQVIQSDGSSVYWSTPTTTSIGSASAGTAIAADDITGWTTNTPTAVTKKTVVTSATFNTVVTGGTTTDVPNISKKTVVTSASGATATYADGILTITNGSFGTGDSVTVGTAIKAYTGLTTGASGSATTGDSVSVTAGTAATLNYTARSIPNISVTSKTVVTGV